MQTVVKVLVHPILEVTGHTADPVAAYRDLLLASPTISLNQPLLTGTRGGKQVVVTLNTLNRALKVMLDALGVDTSLHSLQSQRRGVAAKAAYRAGIGQLDIKHHGMWASEAFRGYITMPFVSASLLTAALADVKAATLQ